MKHALTNLLLTLTATAALASHAGEPRPATDPVPPESMPVITLQVAGGMPVPGGLASRVIRVSRTGLVTVNDRYQPKDFNNMQGGFDEKSYELTQLDTLDMLAIGEAVGALKGGRLVQPKEMGCMDAPGYVYDIVKNGKSITVFETMNCQPLELKDKSQREDASYVKYVLDNLLAQVQRRQN